MTEQDDTATQIQQVFDDAVRALTVAARLDSGPDFAEFVTLAVAAAAANVGGIETALARRPGSWEAEHVRDMLLATVGDQVATLLEHRTEPLVIVVRPDETLSDLGYWRLYDEDEAELQRRYDAPGLLATTRHPDGSVTDVQEAAADAINGLLEQLAALQERDLADYGAALGDAARTCVAVLFPSLPVLVEVTVDLGWSSDGEPDDDLIWTILEWARNEAPLPSSGIAPKDYPMDADIACVEREAGRSPLRRIANMGSRSQPTSIDENPLDA